MLKKLLLSIFLSTALSYAVVENDIQQTMVTKVKSLTTILNNKSDSDEVRKLKVMLLVEDIFDYKIMARISLGKYWKKLTKDQRAVYVEKFTIKLQDSYYDKIKLYTNQKITFFPIEKPKKTRIVLKSILKGDADDYKITYKFYKQKKKDNWFIYDINIVGISILKTYRNQYVTYLKTHNFNELIDSM